MRHLAWTAPLAILVTVGAAQPSLAQSGPAPASTAVTQVSPPADEPASRAPFVGWSASATFVSVYMWRGFVVADAPNLQPTASATFGDLTVTSWVNVITAGSTTGWSEHDLTVDYTRGSGAWKMSAGYANDFFPTRTEGRVSNEFYGGLAWSGVLSPMLKVYQDVSVGNGTYVSAGVSQVFPLAHSGISLSPAVTIGYNHHQWVTGSGWSDLNVGLTVSLPINAHTDVSASFNYSKSFQPDWFPSRGYSGITIAVR